MIVSFTGKKQAGKTLCSDFFVKKGFITINFKDSLIEEIKENFPDLLEHILSEYPFIKRIDDLFEIKPPIVRRLLQNYGTNVRRKDDSNYWVDKWLKKVSSFKGDIIVDDCRFLNEAKTVKNLGGVIIRINRHSLKNDDNHISEIEMDKIKYDYSIDNNKSKKELNKKLKTLYHVISYI